MYVEKYMRKKIKKHKIGLFIRNSVIHSLSMVPGGQKHKTSLD